MNHYLDFIEHFLISVVLILGITLPLIIATSFVYYLVEILK